MILRKSIQLIMQSFESSLRKFIEKSGYEYRDYTASYNKLDFTIHLNNGVWLKLDAKEKRQPLKRSNWDVPDWISPGDEFILDDMSARKILAVAPFSAISVLDVPRKRIFVTDVLDLMFMPRERRNRKVAKNKVRGKWLLSLQNFVEVQPKDLLKYFEQTMDKKTREFRYNKISECYGAWRGEKITGGGVLRSDALKRFDYLATR